MTNEVLRALTLIIGFLSVAAVGYWLTLRLLKPKPGTTLLVLLPFTAADKDPSQVLYAQHIRLQLLGLRRQSVIVALDAGLSAQQGYSCERFCHSVEDMYFCTARELPILLERLQKERCTHGVSRQ